MKLFTFTLSEVGNWVIENDTVMGGESNSTISHQVMDDEEYMEFAGHVTLENNGGFAQTIHRYDNALDVSEFTNIAISGTGDGKEYKIRFETDAPKVAYQSNFIAAEDFESIINFEDLKKVHHGEPAPDAPNFNSANIRTIGILIGNGREEEFKINLKSITLNKNS